MSGGINEGGMTPKPEFLAEHDGTGAYIPLPVPRGRSERILEETARRLGWTGYPPKT